MEELKFEVRVFKDSEVLKRFDLTLSTDLIHDELLKEIKDLITSHGLLDNHIAIKRLTKGPYGIYYFNAKNQIIEYKKKGHDTWFSGSIYDIAEFNEVEKFERKFALDVRPENVSIGQENENVEKAKTLILEALELLERKTK